MNDEFRGEVTACGDCCGAYDKGGSRLELLLEPGSADAL
jgi:hypothetical protein